MSLWIFNWRAKSELLLAPAAGLAAPLRKRCRTIVTERLKIRLRTLASEKGLEEAEAARAMTLASRVARFGEPAEIARAVAFLASPQADYIQGALLDIDGGQTRTL